MAQPNRKHWGKHSRQTVYSHAGNASPIFITEGRDKIQIETRELDSLIMALLTVKTKTGKR